jgi:hypothetical protein
MIIIATHFGDHDISWIPEYAGDDEYFIYDRSGNVELPWKVPRENRGDADYDRLSYICDNYYDLPDVFLLTKSNLFKYISKEEFDEVKDNKVFTPLLTKNHKTYEPICRYDENGMYEEINNSYYLASVPAKKFGSYQEFAKTFNLPSPQYLKFAPGGNYILTRETVHKYGLAFYEKLRDLLPYCQQPGEAHLIERSYFNIWS